MRRLRPTAVLITAVTTVTLALALVTLFGSTSGTADSTKVLGVTVNASSRTPGALPAASEISYARHLVQARASARAAALANTPAARAQRKLQAARRAKAHAAAVRKAQLLREAAAQAQAAQAQAAQAQAAQAQAAQQAAAAQAAAQAQAAQQAAAAQAAAAQAAPATPGAPAGFVPGECGGALPTCCIMMRESGGNPTAYNPSGAAGKWQFMPSTWAGYGGYGSAAQAPEWVQDQRAAQVWAGGAGASNWYGDGC